MSPLVNAPAVPLVTVIAIWAGLVGLVVGSYLNVVAHRLPRGESTVLPRSRCPSCGARISAADNLPLLSFLLLGGRCRVCRAPISWRYPLVEAATAALFVAAVLRFGVRLEALAAAVLSALLVALTAIDVEHFLLPDRLTLPGIALGFLFHQPWGTWRGLAAAAFGAALGAAILLAMIGLWYLVRREWGMGLGDVKMLAMIGAFLGWKGVAVTLFFASASGAATGLLLMAIRDAHLKTRLPFGAFLALGGVVAVFAGDALVDAYARLL